MNMETRPGTEGVNLFLKRFALSPRLFSKAIEMTSGILKSVSPVDSVEILSLCV
ncbi:hypothetical protein E2C01_091355 [Portunus trituberculatus]|uniref:Uncharacterized protein n=1 Tax=Portunus trituberculatus TaxID=210409 RepID=A0A5B7JNC7_PORTR|nr:hypothetical protein [Portunus trituberculatus]